MPISSQRLLRAVALLALCALFALSLWHTTSSHSIHLLEDEANQHHTTTATAISRDVPTLTPRSRQHEKHYDSSVDDSNSVNIHFITVQTAASPGWCRNMKSALRSGIHVFNLGWGQRYAHRARPRWIINFLQSALKQNPYPFASRAFSLDDVVLFSDGADTMFTGVSPATILRRFEALAAEQQQQQETAAGEATPNRKNRDFVMFNAEANCYHQQLFQEKPWGVNKGRCIGAYKRFDPLRRTKWRYLNAGAWIGTARAALWLFSNVTKLLDANQKLWCDQSVIGGMMLGEGPVASVPPSKRLILLDTKNTIFLPTYHLRVQEDVCQDAAMSQEEKLLHGLPESLVLCHSKRAAAVLHFNGKSGSSGTETERRANEFIASRQQRTRSSEKGSWGEMNLLLLWEANVDSRVATSPFEAQCPKFAV